MNEDPAQIIRQVAQRITELRQDLGMTQRDLAQKLGVVHQNVQRIEGGEQNLTIVMMVRVATALDVRMVDLLEPPGSGHPRKRKAPRT